MSSSLPVQNTSPIVKDNVIDFSQTPSYYQLVVDSYKYFLINIKQLNSYSVNEFLTEFKLCSERITLLDISLILILAIGWTLARFTCTKYVFKPIASYFQLTQSDSLKMPESAWKFLFYSSTWSFMAYIIMFRSGSTYFSDPRSVWKNYSLDNPIETEVYAIYLVQLSFYLHSLYSTLRIDQWRKDSPTLMAHHILCVLLISISLATKTHKPGLIAMFLHDGCDILLEGTKITRYFKIQSGKIVKNMDLVTNSGFVCFVLSWFYARLYCFPLKHIYFASVYVSTLPIRVPFIFLISSMLWVLLLMNIYWFTFILKLLYKVITGQIKELDDNREYAEEINSKKSNESLEEDNHTTNGRYYLRQRKINYNLLNTGRSQ